MDDSTDAGSPQRPAGRYDVAILGGGLAGLTLALQLKQARPGTSVLVVDKRALPPRETTFKVGESTADIAGHYLRSLGLTDHLDSAQLRKAGLRFFFSAGDNTDIARRVEWASPVIPEAPGYQLDRGRFENELWQRCLAHEVDAVRGWRVGDVALGSSGGDHVVELSRDEDATRISARWVVDAAGRASLLKTQLGLGEPNDHVVNAAWFRLSGDMDVEQWSDDSGWLARLGQPGQRKHSTCHLVGEGYWVWLIHLASGAVSVGVCADPRFHPFERIATLDALLDWLDAHEPQLAATVRGRRDQVLDFLTVEDFSYDCTRWFSPDRWCLTGEAGGFLDPLYSPGSDWIAMTNTFITDLVGRDLAGRQVTSPSAWRRRRARAFFSAAAMGAARDLAPPPGFARMLRAAATDSRADFLSFALSLVFDGALLIYRDQYRVLGNPQVAAAKLTFESLGYIGVLAKLAIDGQWKEPAVFAALLPHLTRFVQLATRMEALFQEWDALDDRQWQGVSLLLGDYPPLVDRHHDLFASFDDEGLVALIGENLERLFAMAVVVFHKAAGVLPRKLREDIPINALGVSLQPDRWKRDGLFARPGMTLHEARLLVPGCEQIFLDEQGATLQPA